MCKYCSMKTWDFEKIDSVKIPSKNYTDIYLVGNEIRFDNSDDEYADGIAQINYCPMCGKELRKKNV